MKNVMTSIKDNKLTIVIDLNKVNSLADSDLSSTGKNYILASTGGNQPVSEDMPHIKVGINAYVDKAWVHGKASVEKHAKPDETAALKAEIEELKALIKAGVSQATPAETKGKKADGQVSLVKS